MFGDESAVSARAQVREAGVAGSHRAGGGGAGHTQRGGLCSWLGPGGGRGVVKVIRFEWIWKAEPTFSWWTGCGAGRGGRGVEGGPQALA